MNKLNVQRTAVIISAIIFVALGIASSGFWWNVQADAPTSSWSQLDIFTDYHHIPPVPTLSINHISGRVGSYFIVTGSDYPALNTAVINFNDELMGITTIDATGNFIFQFSTSNASNGQYTITITAAVGQTNGVDGGGPAPAAQSHFTLDPTSPNLWTEDDGTPILFDVPTGIASFNQFLPAILSSEQ